VSDNFINTLIHAS